MPSKLLLIQDVADLGRSGDIVKVKPGYARNYLFPKKLALIANKNALHMQETLLEERRKRAVIDRSDSEALAKRLEEMTLTSLVKVDHEGHMYGSVSILDIVHLCKEQQNLD